MNGKRNVSRDLAERIVRRLLLDPQKRMELLELFPEKKNRSRSKDPTPMKTSPLELEASQFKMIAEWEHYAVLSLMNCNDFVDRPEWIAERLGISATKVVNVLRRLLDLNLIKNDDSGKLIRTHHSVRSSDDTVNLSLRKSHEVTLGLAQESLNRDGIHERDFTYVTMAIDPNNISVAKEMIRRFQDELSDVLESGNRTEVYRFSTQLFPFTKLKSQRIH